MRTKIYLLAIIAIFGVSCNKTEKQEKIVMKGESIIAENVISDEGRTETSLNEIRFGNWTDED